MKGRGSCSHCGGDLYREAWYSERGINIDCYRCGQCGSDGMLIQAPDGETWQQGCVEAGELAVKDVDERGCLRPLAGCIPGLEVEQ